MIKAKLLRPVIAVAILGLILLLIQRVWSSAISGESESLSPHQGEARSGAQVSLGQTPVGSDRLPVSQSPEGVAVQPQEPAQEFRNTLIGLSDLSIPGLSTAALLTEVPKAVGDFRPIRQFAQGLQAEQLLPVLTTPGLNEATVAAALVVLAYLSEISPSELDAVRGIVGACKADQRDSSLYLAGIWCLAHQDRSEVIAEYERIRGYFSDIRSPMVLREPGMLRCLSLRERSQVLAEQYPHLDRPYSRLVSNLRASSYASGHDQSLQGHAIQQAVLGDIEYLRCLPWITSQYCRRVCLDQLAHSTDAVAPSQVQVHSAVGLLANLTSDRDLDVLLQWLERSSKAHKVQFKSMLSEVQSPTLFPGLVVLSRSVGVPAEISAEAASVAHNWAQCYDWLNLTPVEAELLRESVDQSPFMEAISEENSSALALIR